MTAGIRRRPWLLRVPSPDARSLLFCFPYLGTGASMFHTWPRMIGDTEVCPLQPPGRENRLREPMPASYEEVADTVATELAPYLDRPIAFFASCSSAFMAYQTALTVTARTGVRPHRLFVSSMVPPDQTPYGSILDVGRDGLVAVLAEMMAARNVRTPPELLDMAVAVLSGDLEVYRRYRPAPDTALPCPATVIAWQDDTNVPPERTLGWAAYGDVRHVVLAGDHWSFLAAPETLLAEIARDMAGARLPSRADTLVEGGGGCR